LTSFSSQAPINPFLFHFDSSTQDGVLVSSGAEGFVAVAEFELVLKLPYQVGSLG
jgi:hypothetical protein